MELHPVLSEANTMKHARHVVEACPRAWPQLA
jgi:hypothetical protein